MLLEALLDEGVHMSLLELGVLDLYIFDQLLLRELGSMAERDDVCNHIVDAQLYLFILFDFLHREREGSVN